MFFHLVSNSMNISFSYDVTVVQEYHSIRHHIDFVKDMR